jgi:hypothetical protein
VGAVGLLDALMGMASAFTDIIPHIIQLGIDTLACVSYLAGGAVSSHGASSTLPTRVANMSHRRSLAFSPRHWMVAATLEADALKSKRTTLSNSSGSSSPSSSSASASCGEEREVVGAATSKLALVTQWSNDGDERDELPGLEDWSLAASRESSCANGCFYQRVWKRDMEYGWHNCT